MRRIRCLGAAPVVALALVATAAALAGTVVKEREIDITTLHLGLTPGGRVGVYLAFTPRRPNALSTVSVAVGERPRMVYGFYERRGLSSPLRDPFENASSLRAGREYDVRISFCRSATAVPKRSPEPRTSSMPSVHAAKLSCAERSFTTMRTTLHTRFDPPSG